MKRSIYYSFLLSTALVAGMTSCSDENDIFGSQGRNVAMTVNINRGEMATRSVLTEEDGDLKCTWEANDLVLVVDNTGKKLGILKLFSGAGQQSATFKGTLTTTAEGNTDVTFLYLGNTSEEQLKALESPVTIDYSAQDGTLNWLIDHDFFSATQNVNVDLSSIEVESVSLLRQLSFGKFEISLPEGVTYNGEAIEISGPGVYTNASVSLTEGTTFSNNGKITITRPENTTSTEFYVAILPTSESITPTFSTTVNGQKYSYTLDARTWTASEFVRKDNGDGTFSGMQLNMTASSDLYGEYENEDPRNPLHKFAKYNLVRVGDRGSLINGFADSEYENGALYQWGRNYGYMDVSGTYPGSKVTISGDFTNYMDALGDYTWYDAWNNVSTSSSMNYYRVFDCYAYPENAVITSGTGLSGYGNGYEWWANLDNYERYGDVDMLKAHPDKYFFDSSNNATDYWISSFAGGGSNWTARATACGYETENPCPEGWKLPTEADFKEICPSSMPSYNGNLSTLITQKAKPELRESNAGVRYVIRWLNYSGYLKIQAVVVDSEFKESDIAAIVWDNNTDVVERIFPYTGNISPYVATDTQLTKYLGQTIKVVFPYTMGTVTQTKMTAGDQTGFILGYADYYYPWTLFTPNKSYAASVGGYWVGDSKKTFQFFDRSKADNSGSSSIDIRTTDAQTAYAIRPVMDTTAK